MSQTTNETQRTRAGLDDLSDDERYRLLAERRRRVLVDLVAQRASPVDFDELARGVAVRERDAVSVDEETVERVKISLHHVHLPVADELGLLEYDPARHRIRPNCSVED